jgi:hypothetical protein
VIAADILVIDPAVFGYVYLFSVLGICAAVLGSLQTGPAFPQAHLLHGKAVDFSEQSREPQLIAHYQPDVSGQVPLAVRQIQSQSAALYGGGLQGFSSRQLYKSQPCIGLPGRPAEPGIKRKPSV